MMNVGAFLFDDFETLDIFGPVEILGRLLEHYRVTFYSLNGELVKNLHGISIRTEALPPPASSPVDVWLIPGGPGTRKEVHNASLIEGIRQASEASKYVLTICTGSALLASTGLLDGRRATSNKRAFNWVMTTGDKVQWIRRARWVVDGKYYTASGVSAGMDMTLGFLSDLHGVEFARKVAHDIEYLWQENKEEDDFAI